MADRVKVIESEIQEIKILEFEITKLGKPAKGAV